MSKFKQNWLLKPVLVTSLGFLELRDFAEHPLQVHCSFESQLSTVSLLTTFSLLLFFSLRIWHPWLSISTLKKASNFIPFPWFSSSFFEWDPDPYFSSSHVQRRFWTFANHAPRRNISFYTRCELAVCTQTIQNLAVCESAGPTEGRCTCKHKH